MRETTLIDKTISRIPRYLELGKIFIASTEIPAGRRYIDLIFVELSDQFDIEHEIISKISSLTSSELLILSYFLDGKRKSKHNISNFLNTNWDTLKNNYLNMLLNKNLLEIIGEKTYKLTDWKDLLPKKIISIEAKINNWNSVLKQAKYNTHYTNESYILYPEKHIDKVTYSKNYFNKKNIGLLTADDVFDIKIKHRPKFSSEKYNYVIEFMKLLIIKNYHNKPNTWITNLDEFF